MFTPATIIPEAHACSARLRHHHSTGHGDERNTGSSSAPEAATTDDMPQEQFVKFIMDKFQNMSLSDIQSLLSRLPNAVVDQPDTSTHCDAATESMDPVDISNDCNSHPFCASRAAIVDGKLIMGQPVMQSTIIKPFGDIETALPSRATQPALPCKLNIPRDPINCPISSCSDLTVFVSDFTKHIKMNHVRVPVEVLRPHGGSNLFIDPALDDVNQNRCRILYLVTDKIR